MKKNSKNLDSLIGSLWIDRHDNRHLKMVVDIQYGYQYNLIISEMMNGTLAGTKTTMVEKRFFEDYRELV
jgi:hypothetical protein